jgi:hypothetical protein
VTPLELRRTDPAAELVRLAASAGFEIGDSSVDDLGCPHLECAAAGATWLTGAVERPAIIDFPLIERARALCRATGDLSARVGSAVMLDERSVFFERSAERGFRRLGETSVNGSCRLLRCADGWVACNLPRHDDAVLVAAALGHEERPADPWPAVEVAAARSDAGSFVEQLQLFGLAVAVLGESANDEPVRFVRLGSSGGIRPRPLVVDFSAMWAGPLCAQVLGRCGAEVVTVEDPTRPDGARLGDPAMYERFHRGHRLARISFSSDAGRRELHRLVEQADVVIESSRPRALGALGLGPETFLGSRTGRCWISITGYGRSGGRANRAAFGDDAAVGGGLVAWEAGRPVFVADAVADPTSGLFAAFGGLAALTAGGGYHVDVSMSAAAAFLGRGPRCAGAHGVRQGCNGRWFATHDDINAPIRSPSEVLGGG